MLTKRYENNTRKKPKSVQFRKRALTLSATDSIKCHACLRCSLAPYNAERSLPRSFRSGTLAASSENEREFSSGRKCSKYDPRCDWQDRMSSAFCSPSLRGGRLSPEWTDCLACLLLGCRLRRTVAPRRIREKGAPHRVNVSDRGLASLYSHRW